MLLNSIMGAFCVGCHFYWVPLCGYIYIGPYYISTMEPFCENILWNSYVERLVFFPATCIFKKKIFLLKYVWILLWAVGIKNQLAFDQEGLNHV